MKPKKLNVGDEVFDPATLSRPAEIGRVVEWSLKGATIQWDDCGLVFHVWTDAFFKRGYVLKRFSK